MTSTARTDMVIKLPGNTIIKVNTKGGTLIGMMSTTNGTSHSMTSPNMTNPTEDKGVGTSITRTKGKDPRAGKAGQGKDPTTEEMIIPEMEIAVGTEILTLVMGGINEETARRS